MSKPPVYDRKNSRRRISRWKARKLPIGFKTAKWSQANDLEWWIKTVQKDYPISGEEDEDAGDEDEDDGDLMNGLGNIATPETPKAMKPKAEEKTVKRKIGQTNDAGTDNVNQLGTNVNESLPKRMRQAFDAKKKEQFIPEEICDNEVVLGLYGPDHGVKRLVTGQLGDQGYVLLQCRDYNSETRALTPIKTNQEPSNKVFTFTNSLQRECMSIGERNSWGSMSGRRLLTSYPRIWQTLELFPIRLRSARKTWPLMTA